MFAVEIVVFGNWTKKFIQFVLYFSNLKAYIQPYCLGNINRKIKCTNNFSRFLLVISIQNKK